MGDRRVLASRAEAVVQFHQIDDFRCIMGNPFSCCQSSQEQPEELPQPSGPPRSLFPSVEEEMMRLAKGATSNFSAQFSSASRKPRALTEEGSGGGRAV